MLANLLRSLDLPAGARIAVQTEKSVEALMLYLAVLRAGYVYLPLNTAYQAGEIEYFIGNAEPSVVVCSGRNFGWVSKLAFKAGTRNVFTLNDDRSGSLLDRAALMSDRHEVAQRSDDDLAAILYTSGTTGRSKGAMLTHGNLLSNARVLKDYWGWRADDVLIHALPIFHVHGLFVASHGALLAGAKMIWFAKFDARSGDRAAARGHRLHGRAHAVRAHAGRARVDAGKACAHMRLFIAGSAPLLLETFNEWTARTGHTILERYGMSETVMLTLQPLRPGAGRAARRHRRLAAAGRGPAHPRRQGPAAADRRDRPHRGQGPERLQGLLAHAGEDRRRLHHRPVVQDRRRRQDRQRRLRHHRRPQQGPDHQRRLQRLSGRDRGLSSTTCRAWPNRR